MTYDELMLRIANALSPIVASIDKPEGMAVHIDIGFSEGEKPSLDEIVICTGLTANQDTSHVSVLEHLLIDRRPN
tara:strand:- start:898 stop:1122 length:225 start_codon:yes stop_codon:yes gene_type:complete